MISFFLFFLFTRRGPSPEFIGAKHSFFFLFLFTLPRDTECVRLKKKKKKKKKTYGDTVRGYANVREYSNVRGYANARGYAIRYTSPLKYNHVLVIRILGDSWTPTTGWYLEETGGMHGHVGINSTIGDTR